jgi:ABC-2 type transport system ATP-binding protein
VAVDDISFAIEKGTSFGLLGPNGSGKTTTVKVLVGLLRPTSGKTAIFGLSPELVQARQKLGYLPENHNIPDYHTPASYLGVVMSSYLIPSSEHKAYIDAYLPRVELSAWKSKKVRTFSKGMRQRLAFVQAIIHNPDLIFLDEPTDGLDPIGRIQIRDIIKELKSRGKTIFINSHLLSEVEQTCDTVAILNHGKIVKTGTIDSLTQKENVFEITCEGDNLPASLEQLRQFCAGVQLVGSGYHVKVNSENEIDKIVDFLRGQSVKVRGIVQKKSTLEEAFIEIIAGKVENK